MQPCIVSVEEQDHVTHSVRVKADTLEAVAKGLSAIQAGAWAGEISQGLNVVKVRVASVKEHSVRIMDFEKWLNRNGGSPRELIQKRKIRELLGRNKWGAPSISTLAP